MNLFDTVYIGSLKVRNHFLRSATYEGKADPDGSPNEEITRIYRELAEGGIGTIITSYTYIADYEKIIRHCKHNKQISPIVNRSVVLYLHIINLIRIVINCIFHSFN